MLKSYIKKIPYFKCNFHLFQRKKFYSKIELSYISSPPVIVDLFSSHICMFLDKITRLFFYYNCPNKIEPYSRQTNWYSEPILSFGPLHKSISFFFYKVHHCDNDFWYKLKHVSLSGSLIRIFHQNISIFKIDISFHNTNSIRYFFIFN